MVKTAYFTANFVFAKIILNCDLPCYQITSAFMSRDYNKLAMIIFIITVLL